ncbi:MAG: 16S rRNA processing protein RimM [Solirubrobacterales bacterium]|nr:MAG: 16S rRNA processing protein RimM [Solirubrobacterales bacterium]
MGAARENRDGDDSAPGAQWLRAGRVGRPHGLDGSFHVRDARPGLLALGVRLRLRARGGAAATPASQSSDDREIVRRAGFDAAPILRLSGCDRREHAVALAGSELLVRREVAPALREDEWYPEELEGCRVFDREHAVGIVRRVIALPSCEALEVERDGDEDLLIPLVRDAVRTVDVEARMIDVDLVFLAEE